MTDWERERYLTSFPRRRTAEKCAESRGSSTGDGARRRRARHDEDAPVDEALRSGLDRVRAVRPEHDGLVVMRYTLADANTPRDFDFGDRLARHQNQVLQRLKAMGPASRTSSRRPSTPTGALRAGEREPQGARRPHRGHPRRRGLSLGHSLEIVKDLGDAESVADQYEPATSRHARDRACPHGDGVRRGHLRRAPRTGRIRSPTSVVHNGQLTNYFQWKRRLERQGYPLPVRVRPRRSSPSTWPRR